MCFSAPIHFVNFLHCIIFSYYFCEGKNRLEKKTSLPIWKITAHCLTRVFNLLLVQVNKASLPVPAFSWSRTEGSIGPELDPNSGAV